MGVGIFAASSSLSEELPDSESVDCRRGAEETIEWQQVAKKEEGEKSVARSVHIPFMPKRTKIVTKCSHEDK